MQQQHYTVPAGVVDEALSSQRKRSAAHAVALLTACVAFEEGSRVQNSAAILAAADRAAAGGLLGAASKEAAVQPAAEDVQPLRVGLDGRETPMEPTAPFEEPVLCREVLRLLLAVVAAHSKVRRLATGWATHCSKPVLGLQQPCQCQLHCAALLVFALSCSLYYKDLAQQQCAHIAEQHQACGLDKLHTPAAVIECHPD